MKVDELSPGEALLPLGVVMEDNLTSAESAAVASCGKVVLEAEVVLQQSSHLSRKLIQDAVLRFLNSRPDLLRTAVQMGKAEVVQFASTEDCSSEADCKLLRSNVQRIDVFHEDDLGAGGEVCNGIRHVIRTHLFKLDESSGQQEDFDDETEANGGESVHAATNWILPSRDFDGLWENLIYDSDVKRDLLSYVQTTVRLLLHHSCILVSIHFVLLSCCCRIAMSAPTSSAGTRWCCCTAPPARERPASARPWPKSSPFDWGIDSNTANSSRSTATRSSQSGSQRAGSWCRKCSRPSR